MTSQTALTNKAGLDRTYVGGIERGEQNPTLDIIAKFAKTLGVDLANSSSFEMPLFSLITGSFLGEALIFLLKRAILSRSKNGQRTFQKEEEAMKKPELITALRELSRSTKHRWKGQIVLALFLADWLERLKIDHDQKYDLWQIEPHIPQLVVDAMEDLRIGTEDYVVRHREEYEKDTGEKVPNLTEVGESDIVRQDLTIQIIGFMLGEIVKEGPNIEQELKAYANAQRHVLQLTFDEFLRLVFRRGLYALINKTAERGMSGMFGDTYLRIGVIAGRTMFTFARRFPGKTVYNDEHGKELWRVPYREISVSFVAENNDPMALSVGIRSVRATLVEAVTMMKDVIKGWPTEPEKQAEAIKPNKNVGLW